MMYNYRKTLLLLLATTAAPGFMANANAASWRVIPSIAVTETYTDNVDLDASFSQSDFVTQVSPQIAITGSGSRLNASLLYAPNYFFYPGSNDKHDLRHTLQANLNTELIRDLFFINTSANIAQRFLDRRQAISSEQSSRTDNRRTVQSYQFSPYLTHAFGTWATARLSYNLSHVRQSNNLIQTTANTLFGNVFSHQGAFSVSSGRRFTKLGWTLSAEHRIEERAGFPDFSNTTLRADFSYQVVRILRLLGSVGYQQRKSAGSFANFKGFIWDAGFRLVPGPRTSLSFRYGNQFDGNTFSLNARYKITAKDNINLSYTDTIQTFQSFAFGNNGAVNIDPSLNTGFISGDLTRRKRWALTLGGTRGRTSYSASAFYSRFKSDNTALDEKRYGGAIRISRNLNRRLSIGGGAAYNLSKFSSDGVNDKFWSASMDMNYRLSKSLTSTIRYVHSDRDQTRFGRLNGGSNYISLSIRATI